MHYRKRLRIAFVHPYLNLGGAERLVVDAALCMQRAGHAVTILTTERDPRRSFAPTHDGTLTVRVMGGFLPAQVRGRLRVPCTLARMAALGCAAARWRGQFDVIVCDLVAHIVPLLQASVGAKVVFYCHFPDLLLVPERRGAYRAYRWPLDRLEAEGARRAARVLVNSRFTQSAYRAAFPNDSRDPEVLYPGVDTAGYSGIGPVREDGRVVLLSVNRFERSKNLGLAIETLACLRPLVRPDVFARVRLVLAGGFDPRLPECAAAMDGLKETARRLGVSGQVEFVLNPTDERRRQLLGECRCLVYTPPNEHFGLSPVEAMAAGRPVLAVNSGGPLETIEDGRTGFLRPPDAEAFAEAAARVIVGVAEARALGEAGRRRVEACFSQEQFGERLDDVLSRTVFGAS